MKNIIFVIICLFSVISINSRAQTATDTETPDKNFIGLLGGYSIPMGNWTKSAYYDNTSGFAGNGGTFAFEGAHFFSKYFGIGGMVTHSAFNISKKGLDSLSRGYQQDFDVDQVTTTIDGAYTMWTFMPGIYLKYPFTDRFSVMGKFFAGFTSTTTPKISVDVEDGGIDDGIFIQQKSTANSFGYMAGLAVSYRIVKGLSLNLSGNYLSCHPDFNVENTNRPISAGRLIPEYNQPITFVNVSLGLAYQFGK
jgi:hypothetical protein